MKSTTIYRLEQLEGQLITLADLLEWGENVAENVDPRLTYIDALASNGLLVLRASVENG